MIDWQVTAVTINCPAVAEEVTIVVKNDWSATCTGCEIINSREARIEMLRRSIKLKRALSCKGIQCQQVTDYVQKLKDEESNVNPEHVR